MLTSAESQISWNVGWSGARKPCLTAFAIMAPNWFFSPSLIKPHQAWEAYANLDTKTAPVTSQRNRPCKPWDLSSLRANIVWADFLTKQKDIVSVEQLYGDGRRLASIYKQFYILALPFAMALSVSFKRIATTGIFHHLTIIHTSKTKGDMSHQLINRKINKSWLQLTTCFCSKCLGSNW